MDGNGSMTNNCCVLVKVPAGFAAVGTHKEMRKLAAEENQTLNLFLDVFGKQTGTTELSHPPVAMSFVSF